jgi:hypothetical protein
MRNEQTDQALGRLLLEQARKLARLGSEPLAIASARNKFNDAHHDDYWCAVQLGSYRWEQSQFFGSSDPDGFGSVNEHGSMRLSRDGYASAEASASDVTAARSILKALDRAGWHDLAKKELRHPSAGDILALVIQFDQVWLHCSDPMGHGDDHVYAVNENGFVELGYIEQRFDDLVGCAEIIACEEPDPTALPSLSSIARAQFDNMVYDQEAAGQLAETLISIALKIDDLLRRNGIDSPRAAVSLDVGWREERYQRYKHGPRPSLVGPRFALGDLYYDRNYYNIINSCAHRLPKAAERLKALEDGPFRQLEEYLRTLSLAEIRPLFERATGINTFDADILKLLIVGPRPYLLYRSRLYPIERDGIGEAKRRSGVSAEVAAEINEWIESLPAIFRQVYARFG